MQMEQSLEIESYKFEGLREHFGFWENHLNKA